MTKPDDALFDVLFPTVWHGAEGKGAKGTCRVCGEVLGFLPQSSTLEPHGDCNGIYATCLEERRERALKGLGVFLRACGRPRYVFTSEPYQDPVRLTREELKREAVPPGHYLPYWWVPG